MEITTSDSMFYELIKSLSNPIRVRILQLSEFEIGQHTLAEILQTSDSRISQNIDVLEDCGLIEIIRKEKGKKYVRRITNSIIFQILSDTTSVGHCSE